MLREATQRIQKRCLKTPVLSQLTPGRRDYTKFIIGGMGRTGSNLLVGCLKHHNEVIAYSEIFNNKDHNRKVGFSNPEYRNTDRSLIALRDADPVRFLDTVIFRKAPTRIRAIGFKLFYYHARGPQDAVVWDYLRAANVRVIHLKRRNLLALQLSMTRALGSHAWTGARQGTAPETRIALSYEECLEGFEQVDRWQREFDTAFPDQLPVYYEDLCTDREHTMRQVCEYLDVAYQPTRSRTQKQSRLPLDVAISNYDELKGSFSGSRWASFFEESEPASQQ